MIVRPVKDLIHVDNPTWPYFATLDADNSATVLPVARD